MVKVVTSFLNRFLGWMAQKDPAVHRHAESPIPGWNDPAQSTQVLRPACTLMLRPEPEGYAKETNADPGKDTARFRHLFWHGMSDIGMVRSHNEDCFCCRSLGQYALFVVADGMGGHDAGEVASRIAVETVCADVRAGVQQMQDPLLLVSDAVRNANSAVKQEGASRGSDMGTTLGVALVSDDEAFIASVGDSRIYWIENGSITQVTDDHSLVARLVATGKLTREEARNHPKANLLYRTVGTDERVTVDTFRVGLKAGGSLLLCTDGLWGMVPDEDIRTVCNREQDPQAACIRLVRMANENGGRDNITAVVVKIV
jgi:protein phosphatase